jgi:tetratricopeptide (TPR) repeat protein
MLLRLIKDLVRARKQPVVEQAVVDVAREMIGQSRHAEAIDVLSPLLEQRPDCVEALLLRGVALRACGRTADSLDDLTRVCELDGGNVRCVYELAMTSYVMGDHERALELCQQARAIDPAFGDARFLHAQLLLGGEYYFKILARIHAELRPRTYVEIGVFRGESLALAAAPTQAIGVDPQPQIGVPLQPNQRLFVTTSDAFFSEHDVAAEFGGLPVDLAFIDGMHHFEFALRDFVNLERYCTRDSTILIHDCYPLDRETARRDGEPPFWSGDIWRLIVLLKKHRPDLAVHTIGAPPTGLGIVRNLDPDSRFLAENHDRLCAELMALDFDYLSDDKPGKLNLVRNEWERVRSLLHG